MRKLSHLFGLLVLLALLPGQAFAQNLRVEGQVLDELGEGLSDGKEDRAAPRWTKPAVRDAILQAYQENRIQ